MGFPTLDSSLCYFIFFPVTVISLCVELIKKYAFNMMKNNNDKEIRSATKTQDDFNFTEEMKNRDTDIKLGNAIARANLLKNNYMFISERGFKKRQAFLSDFFSKEYEPKEANPMNTSTMTTGLKNSAINGLYYLTIFVIGGYFFSGYLLLKLPFGLTQKFKNMTQQGLTLPDFSPSYVSAISWCIMLGFGLGPLIQFFAGGEYFSNLQHQATMMNPMAMMAGNPLMGKNYSKMLKAEKESVEIINDFSLIEESVDRLLEKYGY